MTGIFDLKDETQAKEYLDRIGVEYRFQCYSENRPDGCHRLGDYFEAFKREYDKARTVYAKNCKENRYGASCFKLGNYSYLGRGCDKDTSAALSSYQLGCDVGHGPSCHNAALLNHAGLANADGSKDYRTATKFLIRGCEAGNVPSCQLLSTYYITGKDGVPRDMEKAFAYAKQACDQGHMYACHNISRMYRLGEGTSKNDELATFYQEKAKELRNRVTETEPEIKFGE